MLISFQGDANLRVVALQLLLNRFRIISPNLKVDGQYGGKTAHAVQGFRGSVMLTSGRGDVEDGPVWQRLICGTSLQVLDIVDVTDPAIVDAVVPDVSQFTVPILIGAMSNGVGTVVSRPEELDRDEGGAGDVGGRRARLDLHVDPQARGR